MLSFVWVKGVFTARGTVDTYISVCPRPPCATALWSFNGLLASCSSKQVLLGILRVWPASGVSGVSPRPVSNLVKRG